MPNANTGLEDAARLLDLVPFIISHQGVAIDVLATKFGVTTDEITSDLMTLWMCGLPGYTAYELIDLSFDSGFVTISNAQTLERPRTLERNEALALILGLETLLEEIPESNISLRQIVTSLISKVAILLGEKSVLQVQAGTPVSASLRAEISNALAERKYLKITYHSTSRDELSERTISPLEFSSRGGVEYLDGFCLTSGGFRTFRLDRIEKLEVIPATLQSLSNSSDSLVAGPFNFTLNILSRPRDALERFSILNFVDSQNEIALGQSFSQEWAIREIMAFGADVVAISPELLREQIRERASKALIYYKK